MKIEKSNMAKGKDNETITLLLLLFSSFSSENMHDNLVIERPGLIFPSNNTSHRIQHSQSEAGEVKERMCVHGRYATESRKDKQKNKMALITKQQGLRQLKTKYCTIPTP